MACILVAKWGKERIIVDDLTLSDNIRTVKDR